MVSSDAHLIHPKYRADIDGLRAIAVLAVVVFHAFPAAIPGGFIGVDIFFVISGFLISTIIFGSLECNSFSFAEFYGRRIRRIFPALALVLLVVFVLGWFVLLADEYKQLGKHIAGGAGFISNFILWNESGYFDQAAETKPLLHLWSLGIEEQFYIIWPLLLWLAWRWRSGLPLIMLVLGGASLILNIEGVKFEAIAAFYSPQTRFWELLAGSMLAYWNLSEGKVRAVSRSHLDARMTAVLRMDERVRRDAKSLLGIGLIVAGFMTITKTREFPGWWALLPVAGAVLLISAGAQAWVNRVVLSNRILVWFGLISFPLYLWHWPLLVYARIIENGIPAIEVRAAAVSASIGLAWLTYRLIERPIRTGGHFRVKTYFLMVLMAIAGVAGWTCYRQGGWGLRDSVMQVNLFSEAINDWTFPAGLIARNESGVGYYAGDGRPAKVMLFGDSHIEQFGPRLVALSAQNKTMPFAMLTEGGCPPIPFVYEDKHPNCVKNIDNFLALTRTEGRFRTIVIGGCWNCYFIEDQAGRELLSEDKKYDYYFLKDGRKIYFRTENGKELALKSLKDFLGRLAASHTVYLLLDNPQGEEFDPRAILGKRRWIVEARVQPSQWIRISPDQIRLNTELKALGEAAGVRVIDQMSHLCDGAACRRINEDGRPVYKDSNHLRPYFVIENGAYLDPALREGAALQDWR